ncbi:CDGSH iron-sulfur domain-containing protein [Dyella telluris]|uniref:CDGSH iron-sulfur domain-containing protein n=1 Tax=Dyella telluris TaxID=2763498 RepID=UPI001C9B549F|nr:CDGSH iron-sulfur domain-containing protein [Dyella telluris]
MTVSKNGPYLVVGDIALAKQTTVADAEGGSQAWEEGPPLEHAATYALCRCGHSKSKPFCDGSHQKVGFDGTETAPREPYLDQAKVMNGPVHALTDVENLCAFARYCDPNGQVWSQVADTENPQVRENFLRQVNRCPSGRLVAWDRSTGEPVENPLPVSIGLIEDPVEKCSGPLWLRGGIPVIAADGFAYEVRNRVTLCRCGQSKNKPFCDGTHAAIHFRD